MGVLPLVARALSVSQYQPFAATASCAAAAAYTANVKLAHAPAAPFVSSARPQVRNPPAPAAAAAPAAPVGMREKKRPRRKCEALNVEKRDSFSRNKIKKTDRGCKKLAALAHLERSRFAEVGSGARTVEI